MAYANRPDVRKLVTKRTHFTKHICTKQRAVDRILDGINKFEESGIGQPTTISYFANEIRPQNHNNILDLAQDVINDNGQTIKLWLDDADTDDKLTIMGVNRKGTTGYGINMDMKDKSKPITTTSTNVTTVVLKKNKSSRGCELCTVFPETRPFVIKMFKETYPEIGTKIQFKETSEPGIKKEIYASPAFKEMYKFQRGKVERRIPTARKDYTVIMPDAGKDEPGTEPTNADDGYDCVP